MSNGSLARLLLAAPESGSGKTLITAGLGLALRKRGLAVQMFKCGPDYIDPTYHRLASGRACRNLDAWMLPKDVMAESFVRNAWDADVAIIEGVMGLFDGFGVLDNEGSSAEIAHLLQTPIILILPVRGQARSAAATVKGFNTFSPDTTISGVILNKVGSPRHADMCKQAIEAETGVPVLGYLPRNNDFDLPERHLGLIPTDEEGQWLAVLEKVAAQLEESVELDAVLKIASTVAAIRNRAPKKCDCESRLQQRARIAVAADEAFTFTYPENIELLQEAGAEIVKFSPLQDSALPENIDALILSGGFPEIYAAALSENAAMRESVRISAENNLPIYAECGGLMYLTQAITDHDGNRHPMVGALPGECAMTYKVKLGYRLVEAIGDGPVLRDGEKVRGHEFHYSTYNAASRAASTGPTYNLHDPRGKSAEITPAGIQHRNIWASYIHIHFLSKPIHEPDEGIAQRFVAWCKPEPQPA